MKPYMVVMQIQDSQVHSRAIPVYGHDEAEAIERAERVLDLEHVVCDDVVSCTEGWPPGSTKELIQGIRK